MISTGQLLTAIAKTIAVAQLVQICIGGETSASHGGEGGGGGLVNNGACIVVSVLWSFDEVDWRHIPEIIARVG